MIPSLMSMICNQMNYQIWYLRRRLTQQTLQAVSSLDQLIAKTFKPATSDNSTIPTASVTVESANTTPIARPK